MVVDTGNYTTNMIEIKDNLKLEVILSSGWCIGQVEYDETKSAQDVDWIKVIFIRQK